VTKTGFDANVMGDYYKEFEWSSKSRINTLSAIFNRQLSSHLTPDASVLKQFSDMSDRFFDWFSEQWKSVELQGVGYGAWIDTKSEFSDQKKLKYYKTYCNQFYGKVNKFVGNFSTMVKSGEVYYTSSFETDAKGLTINQESRPRNICIPDELTCGYLTYLQSTLWEPIKKILPGFVQGYTKSGMMDLFRKKVRPDMMSISIDGSAFDSSQLAELMDLTDNRMWKVMRDSIESLLARDGWSDPVGTAN
jgi:hypothetical protein